MAKKSIKKLTDALVNSTNNMTEFGKSVRDSAPAFDKFLKQGIVSNNEFLKNREAFNTAITNLQNTIKGNGAAFDANSALLSKQFEDHIKNLQAIDSKIDVAKANLTDTVNNFAPLEATPTVNSIAAAPQTAAGGGGSTIPPKTGIKEFFSNAWDKAPQGLKNVAGYVKANPWESAGLGLLGAGNIAGLFDNDKVGGQLLGGGLGTAGALLIPKLLNKAALSTPAVAGIGMGAGAVGALFDALRANADKKRQEAMMLQGGYPTQY